MTLSTAELDTKTTHRSFRLTRPGKDTGAQQVAPSLVLSDRDVREIASVAVRQDVSKGGCFSAGPAGVQVWSTPWDGPLGSRGESEHLGSIDWSYDTPVKQYATIYRVLVTVRGVAAGENADSILGRALALAGMTAPGSQIAPVVAPPRDPFRSALLRQRP